MSFKQELADHGLSPSRSSKSCDIAFVLMHETSDLKSFDKFAHSCAAGTHIWAVYPKGKDGVGQTEVMSRAKGHGMGPGKGIAFDDVYSAMRFTKK